MGMTREDTIKGLECCAQEPELAADCVRLGCPYSGEESCIQAMCRDAAALLEERAPIVGEFEDSDGGWTHWLACGRCQAPIYPEDEYCHECGTKVKRE